MSSTINWSVLTAILTYVLVQFAIGVWYSRKIATDVDYILAGRKLGTGLVAFSVFATWFGAEAIQVSAGEIYDKGLSAALTDPVGYGFAVVIVALLLAAPLWRRGVTTFADMIRERYSSRVEKLFVLVLLPGSVFWAAAQVRAFGQLLSSTGGIDLSTAILISAVLIAAYTTIGGLLADAVTDLIQGIAVIVGLCVLFVFVAISLGGVQAGLATVPADRLQPFSSGGESPLAKVEKLAIVLCGSIVSVELISRFLGARSASVARSGTLIGGLMYLGLGLLPIFLGLVGPGLVKGLDDPEQLVPRLAAAYLPPLGYALFLGALVSAILSVVHAALHAPAAHVSHNIITRLRPDMTERNKLISVRLTVVALSIVALFLAQSVERIKELVETASAFGSAGAFVVVVLGLFTRFGGPACAVAALLTGIAMWLSGKYIFAFELPYLFGLASACLAYVAASLFERTSDDRRDKSRAPAG
jgi:SSS family transporter